MDRLVALSLDLLSVAGADGRFRWLSKRWTEVLGWSLDELYDRPFVDLLHPDDLEATARALADFGEHGEVRGFRNRYRHKNGEWRWLEWNSSGRDGLFYSVTRDVTETRDRDHRAAENTRLLMMAEEMAAIGHWHLDLEKEQLIWSDEVYRIHGRDPATFEPRLDNAIEAYHPDDRDAVSSAVARAIEARGEYEFALRIVRPDGTVRDVISTGKCLTGEDDKAVALFGVFQDITESNRLRAHLAQSDRMVSLGTMAAGIAHEISNPLTWTIGTLELVAEAARRIPGEDGEGLQGLARDAIQGAERVADIARGLKTFSQPEVGVVESLHLHELVEESIRLAQNHVRHRAHLKRCFSDVEPIKGRATDLVQVFTNLLVNAAQAIPAGAADEHVIQVSIEQRDDSTAVVEVLDTGKGMSPDVIERIFEPFFTTKGLEAGTGLGLSICHGLVSGLGGTIEIDSRPERGTKVQIVLPLDPGLVVEEPAIAEVSERPGASVLVIDDEQAIRSFVTRALNKADARAAESGPEAIQILEGGFVPDLIICDLMMPTMTGRDVHAEIGRRWPSLQSRMIFATGGTFTNEMTEWLDSVDNPVLDKPFRLATLRGLLDQPAA